MSTFEQIAHEHAKYDAAYRREEPYSPDWDAGRRAAQRALHQLWAADPGHDPFAVARYIVALVKAERTCMAGDDGSEDGSSWEPDDGFLIACRVEEMAARIVVAAS